MGNIVVSLAQGSQINIASAALAVAIFVSITKFLITMMVPATSPYQNSITRLYVILVSLGVILVNSIVAGSSITAQLVLGSLGEAFTVSVAAIASYHLLTGLDQAVPPVDPLGPKS